MRIVTVTLCLVAMVATPLAAQHEHQHSASPYAGREAVEGTVLSVDEIAQLRAGEGMGLALPAELHHYPGPLHVLEHAPALELTPDQRARIELVRDRMSVEARALGEEVIEAERALVTLFRAGAPTPDAIDRATRMVGEARARLQAIHLRAHLETTELLDPEQVRRYDELRGYRPG